MADMDDYFYNKFYPLQPMYVLGRSYAADPPCKPEETLFDCWKDFRL